jgi:heterodisulfide reductase subunit A
MSEEKVEPRVGVFVCRCGLNVAKSVDTTSLKEYASELPGVVYAEESDFACSDSGLKTISEAIKSNGINRVVVAGCSPWLHEPTFQRMMERVKLNKYLLEMANIREHCALLYSGQILKATEKAKFLVKAAVERAKTLEPIEKKTFSVQKSVLVIGGGVAGVEASKRLGDLGMEVFLIEKTPFLGGKVLQLGSVFPSDDCGTCVSPCGNDLHRRCFYRNTVANHDHINILTSAELRKLAGHVGNYKATIGVSPRFVNQELCMGCDRCADVCPVEVPNEFNFGFDKRKAIYILSDQALPRIYAIDPGTCTRCGKCVEACPVKAIDLSEQPREITVDIGAVVVASGFETFDPKGMYGYGENPNIITQLQLARMLDQSGPTRGRVIRPGDGQEPKRIAMIQCVGSRDPKIHEYCSKICCGIAVKHATEIMESYPEVGLAIIHKDIRLTGKHYEDYYYRAQNLGVRLLRGEVKGVTTMPDGSIHVDVEDEFGEVVPLHRFGAVRGGVRLSPEARYRCLN